MDDVVIVGAARTPIGRFNSAYSGMSAIDLGAAAIQAAVQRAGIEPDSVDECIMGCVVTAGLGQSPARQQHFALAFRTQSRFDREQSVWQRSQGRDDRTL
jgi:acetyl-CoA acetyltransferase (EC 2.3.1.9)